jgi:hypothetical protein
LFRKKPTRKYGNSIDFSVLSPSAAKNPSHSGIEYIKRGLGFGELFLE